MRSARRTLWLGLAGLLLAPLVWGVNTEFGTFIPSLYCASRGGAWLAALALLAALAAAALSWRGRVRAGHAEGGAMPFAAWLGSTVALLLALAVALQFLATLVLDGCEA